MYALEKNKYIFNPATKQVTFYFAEFSPEKVRAITDMTMKTIMYAPQTGGLGGTFSNNVLTLDLDTTTGGFASTDVLEVLYDVENFYNKVWKTSFTDVIASGVDTKFWTLIQTGAGQAVSQSASNLVLTSGTTTNSETIIRSNIPFSGNFLLREITTLSQRIINNNFSVELVDVIGDGLSYTITNATTVVVTIPSNTFTAVNVGQSIHIGTITGAAGIPMIGVIASVAGNNVTFTVSGWPASGTGTCSLFGWNEYSITYNTATATNAFILNRRNGWALAATTATISTTVSPGHMGILAVNTDQLTFADQLVASATTYQVTPRASAVINLPDSNVRMYIQIRSLNGTVAPASTTTWTLGGLNFENYDSIPVILEGAKYSGVNNATAVKVLEAPSTAVTGTITASNTAGTAAHSAAASGNPVRIGGKAVTAADTTLVNNDTSDILMTSAGYIVEKPFSIPELDWQYTGLIVSAATTTLKAATASVKTTLVALQYMNTNATATTLTIQDSAGTPVVLWQGNAPASMTYPAMVYFPIPLKTSTTNLNINLVTSAAGNLYFNAQGYSALAG